MFMACLFLSLGMALAQTKVTGTVVSQEDGQPIIGATVWIDGTSVGTATDVNGKFTLTLPSGKKMLRVSSVGMESVTVAAQSTMRITLKSDAKALSEVVVTGYGSARKAGTIAGSVTTLSGEQLQNRPVANIGDAMQGQVSGVQVFTSSGEPSATASMYIRGVTSIYASTQPLYILDGSEISSNTFLSLNPNDVESMTVLKDASATAIYGSRAANGVILITSKRGKYGEAPTITLSAQYGVSEISGGDKMELMNASQWLDFQEMLDPANKANAGFQSMKKFYVNNGIGTDWKDVFFGGSAPTSQIDLSIRGGSQNTSYLLSYGHFDQDGIMDDSNMRRESFRANIEANINPWLKVGANSNLAYTKTMTTAFGGSTNSVYNKAFAASMYLPIQTYHEIKGLYYNDNGTIDYDKSTFEGYGARLNYFDLMGYYNPYWLSEVQPSSDNRLRINENAFININPIKGLNIRSALGLDFNDLRSSYTCYNTLPEEPGVFPTGSRRESFSRFYRWTVTNTAEYKFNFLDKHSATVLLGQETMTSKSEAFRAETEGHTDNRLTLLSAGATPLMPTHSISEEVRNSWFGMLNYSYADKYFVDLSIRRDGSSLFGENNQWATFGAAAFMWNISKENFMSSTKGWLNDLSAKVSYGSTGNSGIDPYMALGLVGTGPMYAGQSGTAIANPSNPDLTWETVKTVNVGLNGKVLDKITFEVEYYNKVTSDMLMSIPYSYTTGFSSGWGNIAEMKNTGFDFTIGADIIKTKDWYWNVKVNGNYNKNEITKLFEGVDHYNVGTIRLEVGHPYGEFYRVRWSHVDPVDGQNVWLDKHGNETKKFSEEDMVMTGKTSIAPWSGGLSTTVAWKGLQLDVQFSGMFDRYMFNNYRWFTENPTFASSNNQTTEMFRMWQKPGDITDIAAANAEYHIDDDRLIEDASFVRLKFLQLSYSLPKKWMDATGFVKGAKVYFVGRNLLTFTKYSGYDPEVDSSVNLGNYPNTRQYSIGAQFTF